MDNREPARNWKILIVDDAEDVRELLSETLRYHNYPSITAVDGRDGFEKFEANPDIRFVITDMDMPVMNGLEFIQKLRAAKYDVPILVLTGRKEVDTAIKVIKAGADDYLVKDGGISDEILIHTRKVFEMRKISDEVKRLNGMLKEANAQLQTRNEFIRKTFGRYMSDEVVEKLLESPDGLKLGGDSLTVTVIMTDLRGFSALCEKYPPATVVKMLNNYLKEMTDIIFRHNGTINEILGDALLILFGAPVTRPDDADRAIACAIEMQLAMDRVNGKNREAGLPELEMGIGINTGTVVAGNLGSDIRAKYAVVGSHVNLAGRVESFTVGRQILATESTIRAAKSVVKTGEEFTVPFKGFAQPVRVCEVRGIGGEFNLSLPVEKTAPVPLERKITVAFEVLEGKHSTGQKFIGALTALAENTALLRSGRELPIHANLVITITWEERAGSIASINAKVMKEAGEGEYHVNFTFVPPEARAFFNTLRGGTGAK
ncbi:MAG: response regulator [Nitrospinae bacterium]|nr:response regulator [Nitrospinota bacterium]